MPDPWSHSPTLEAGRCFSQTQQSSPTYWPARSQERHSAVHTPRSFSISGQEKEWLGQPVVADINPVFNFEYLPFIFNHYTEDGSAYSWLLRFKDQEAEDRFQEGPMQEAPGHNGDAPFFEKPNQRNALLLPPPSAPLLPKPSKIPRPSLLPPRSPLESSCRAAWDTTWSPPICPPAIFNTQLCESNALE
ncbi:MAG: hypothetical protein Q9208_007918 [Pyrenodesmia sp. 3 TL-2023]